jgi:tetratricopeptide (TPR) repeat protein
MSNTRPTSPSTSSSTPNPALPDLKPLWDFGDPAGTRANFAPLLELELVQAPENRDYRLQVQTQIARTHGLETNFAAAHAVLDAVRTKLDASTPVAEVRYHLERGRAFRSGKQPVEARPCFLKAWNLARDRKLDGYAVDAAHMMGILEGEDTLAWNRKAIAFAETSDDPAAKAWLGSLYNNTGWSLHELGDFEGALELWERQVTWYDEPERAGNTKMRRIARWMVARGLRSLGRHDEALSRQRELLAAAGDDPAGYTHEEIAENLLALGRAQEAAPHFKAAFAALKDDQWLQRDEAERLARMERLGGGAA